MPINTPDKIITPWATSGLRVNIPEAADPILGRAGFDLGFPAINMTPKNAGGIPPFGQDFNGIFYDVTQALQYLQAGGSFPYDGAWAAAVGGYPIGALVSRSDNQGLWRNTVADNLTDPESGGTGWQPEGSGATAVTMTSSNVALTPLQAAQNIIIISGALTSSLQLIFPEYVKQWLIVNKTTGDFEITCKTALGAGVEVKQGSSAIVYGDGVDIRYSTRPFFDYLDALRVDVASAANVNLTAAAPDTRNINITGTTSISGFIVPAGQLYLVSFSGALTLVNGAGLVTNRGTDIAVKPGDSCWIRATADNVVEIVCGSFIIDRALGVGQTRQGFVIGVERSANTDYTNTTSRPIEVTITLQGSSGVETWTVVAGGVTIYAGDPGVGTPGTSNSITFTVLPGEVYRVNSGIAGSLTRWVEIR